MVADQGHKMTSRELGLVLAQQLLGVEDLHYGLWEDDLALSLANLVTAQQRYTDLLLGHVAQQLAGIDRPRVLDVGCGTGHMLELMRERGYAVDAVNPSPHLNRLLRQRLAQCPDSSSSLFEVSLQCAQALFLCLGGGDHLSLSSLRIADRQ